MGWGIINGVKSNELCIKKIRKQMIWAENIIICLILEFRERYVRKGDLFKLIKRDCLSRGTNERGSNQKKRKREDP